MTAALIVVIVILAVAVSVLVGIRIRDRGRSTPSLEAETDRRILFPFVLQALSTKALDAALRLAGAEGATLVPVFLAQAPLDLPLDTPLPRQCSLAVPLLEAVEQRATEAGVPVDSRIERGRNRRHALRRAIAEERFDRIVIAAASEGSPGFDADDVAWLLENAPGEIVVLRPGDEDPGPVLAPAPRPRTVPRRRPSPDGGALPLNGGGRPSRAGETAGSR